MKPHPMTDRVFENNLFNKPSLLVKRQLKPMPAVHRVNVTFVARLAGTSERLI